MSPLHSDSHFPYTLIGFLSGALYNLISMPLGLIDPERCFQTIFYSCLGAFSVFLFKKAGSFLGYVSKMMRKDGRLFSLLPIGLIGLAILALTKAKALGKITYTIGVPDVGRMQVKASGFNLTLFTVLPITFLNPSPTKATFSDLFLALKYNGATIGKVYFPGVATIQDRDETIVETALNIPLTSVVLQIILQVLAKDKKIKDIEIVGVVKGEGFNVPISERITIPIPAFISEILEGKRPNTTKNV